MCGERIINLVTLAKQLYSRGGGGGGGAGGGWVELPVRCISIRRAQITTRSIKNFTKIAHARGRVCVYV